VKRLALLAALFVVSANAQAVRAPSPAAQVSQAANGAFVLGNPAAKVRLVEYLSYTCSHCAQFLAESSGPLKQGYVAKASVAVEVRNAVRDRYDFAAALLARCGGAAKFFGNTEMLMATQDRWLAKAPAFDAANGAKMAKMPINQSLRLITRGLGLDVLMKARGFSPAQLDACLIDKNAQDRVVAMTSEAWNVRKLTGTPSFLINGTAYDGPGHWSNVETALQAALAAK
jgi:protein-disulfide isomerase